MRTDDFDFDLPDELIALRPAEPRDSARLLEVRGAALADLCIADLPDRLRDGDVLVFNDTRVIPAALSGIRRRGAAEARIHVNLHKRLDASRWLAFARPARRIEIGERIAFGHGGEMCELGKLDATVSGKHEAGEVELTFDLAGPDLDFAIAAVGAMPLPPYIASRRPADEVDRHAYQTVYAARDGAVAAPTAGLHFTPELLDRIEARGIATEFLTLHVGAGTFLPVKTDRPADHRMHAEWGEMTEAVATRLNRARQAGGRLIAVGTTVTRLLESAAGRDGTIHPFRGETEIFIAPGHSFRAVDAMLTNFHLPRSTLFMLVSAFAGLANMQAAYAHAVACTYRFYSYGDA
ncbi:MAG: tRNA preQ1(34) S-adenosylmethionine ribosyltransferase-isomerase QueA, partial [Alphaproteobacteria bacterium]|nr:tRNA preQ1(34) S-adenosylmethionine ribosyltransferase-isomerase QueA [Alphaproteobacteria bacterium]